MEASVIELRGFRALAGASTWGTFETVPDVPFETFEATLPEGPYSALAANGNLCVERNKLIMPTVFKAQNGLEIHQNTKIAVTGCPKAKKSNRKHRKRHKARRASHKARRASRLAHRSGR